MPSLVFFTNEQRNGFCGRITLRKENAVWRKEEVTVNFMVFEFKYQSFYNPVLNTIPPRRYFANGFTRNLYYSRH